MREAAAGIRDTKEAGKRKKRYETAKRNLDSDVCGDNAGDADGAVCESARPAGKDDPRVDTVVEEPRYAVLYELHEAQLVVFIHEVDDLVQQLFAIAASDGIAGVGAGGRQRY